MAAIPQNVGELMALVAGLKDHGIPLASVDLMVETAPGMYVAATAEFVRNENTSAKYMVIRPRPAGAS